MTFSLSEHGGISVGGRVSGLDLTDDGALLAVSCLPRQGAAAVQVWRTEDATLVASFGVDATVGRGVSAGEPVVHAPGVAFASGGTELWFGLATRSQGPTLWRAGADLPPEAVAHYTPQQFQGLIRSPDGRLLGVVGANLEIRDLSIGQIVRLIASAGALHQPMRACFSTHEASVCLYGRDPGSVVVHDLTTGKDIASHKAPTPFGRHVAISRTGRWLLVAGKKGTYLHDRETGECHEAVGSSTLAFDSLRPGHLGAFSHDGATLLVFDGVLYCIALDAPDLPTVAGSRPPVPLGAPIAVTSAKDAPLVAWATNNDLVFWAVDAIRARR